MAMLIGPFVSEVATNTADAGKLIRTFAALTVVIAVGGAVALVGVGPVLLGYLGEEYRNHGVALLILGALTLPFMAINIFYGAMARLRQKLGLAIIAKVLAAVLAVGGAFALVGEMGIVGAGYAFWPARRPQRRCSLPLIRLLRQQFRRRA